MIKSNILLATCVKYIFSFEFDYFYQIQPNWLWCVFEKKCSKYLLANQIRALNLKTRLDIYSAGYYRRLLLLDNKEIDNHQINWVHLAIWYLDRLEPSAGCRPGGLFQSVDDHRPNPTNKSIHFRQRFDAAYLSDDRDYRNEQRFFYSFHPRMIFKWFKIVLKIDQSESSAPIWKPALSLQLGESQTHLREAISMWPSSISV